MVTDAASRDHRATTTAATTLEPGHDRHYDDEPRRAAEYYAIRPGDTLSVIADDYDTTLDELLALNPEVDPVAPNGRPAAPH